MLYLYYDIFDDIIMNNRELIALSNSISDECKQLRLFDFCLLDWFSI